MLPLIDDCLLSHIKKIVLIKVLNLRIQSKNRSYSVVMLAIVPLSSEVIMRKGITKLSFYLQVDSN